MPSKRSEWEVTRVGDYGKHGWSYDIRHWPCSTVWHVKSGSDVVTDDGHNPPSITGAVLCDFCKPA